MSLLESQVTAYLTSELGRAPSSSEVAQGIISPWTLANVHNSLNVGQSVLTINNTQSIQDAIDEVSANGGGVVYLQGGTYTLTDNLTLPSNVRLSGVGSQGSIIDFGGAAYQVQVVGEVGTYLDTPSIVGVTVQNSSIALIKIQYVNNFYGNDITCLNGLVGIDIDDATIVNINIYSPSDCGTGMTITNCAGMTLNNADCSGSTSGGGFIFDTVNNATFINSSTESGTGDGISMTDCSDFTLDSFSIIDMTGNGLALSGTTVMSAASGTVTDNGGDGVNLNNSTLNCQFITCNFNDNGGYGVNIVDAGSSDNLFSVNDFSGNSSGAMNDSGTGTLIRSNIGLADK